jgi:cytochrome oxidase assembly protein ShyY1
MLALAVLWAGVSATAARWQWGRYEERSVLATAIESHYSAAPISFTTVVPSTSSVTSPTQEWTRVSVTGRYDDARRLYVRNRSQEAGVGYEVLLPLETPGGILVVDRGWVANGRSANELPPVPQAPSGEVTVIGWLRASENEVERDLPAGQLVTVNTAAAGQAWGRATYRPYLVLDTESPAPSARPTPLDPPEPDLGPHQGYAVQWWIFSVFGFVFVGVGVRGEVRAARNGTEGAPDRVLEPASPKVRKARLWDEEDE